MRQVATKGATFAVYRCRAVDGPFEINASNVCTENPTIDTASVTTAHGVAEHVAQHYGWWVRQRIGQQASTLQTQDLDDIEQDVYERILIRWTPQVRHLTTWVAVLIGSAVADWFMKRKRERGIIVDDPDNQGLT